MVSKIIKYISYYFAKEFITREREKEKNTDRQSHHVQEKNSFTKHKLNINYQKT